MLSTENPPLDPPSHLQIPATYNGFDEKKTSSSSCVQQDPDLLNPVPKFSIRDYVFASRTKDLSKNWPFSEKNLQLCIKHGTSDMLPPFQTPDVVRSNPFLKRKCPGEKAYPEKEGKICHTVKKQEDELNLGICKQNLAASDCLDIILCESEGIDTGFVSKSIFLESEKLQGKEQEAKTRHRRPPGKKFKLVKSTSEEIVVSPKNYTVISESMASKGVCPVCKNFSSSSNTTLNAHIDQCLSGESTMKWAPSLPVIKYRVKPRKTRLMVDIYKSATYCTLDELERRNGRSWAMNSRFQAQEGEVQLEEKVEKVSNVNFEANNGNVGDVYIDTDGTKVRMLSKLTGVESGSKIGGDDSGARKLLKGDKGKKLFSVKKKVKLHKQKQPKFLKPGKNSLSRKSFRNYEVCGSGEGRKEPTEETFEKGEMQTDLLEDDHNSIKKGNSGAIKKCSSSTVPKKTSRGENEHQYLGQNSRTNPVLESGQSTLGNLHSKKRTRFSENPISIRSSQRTDIGECRRQLPLRERKCFLSDGSKIGGCEKRIKMNADSIKYSDDSGRMKPSITHQEFSPKAKRFSSLQKNLESAVDPTIDFNGKCSARKNSPVHFASSLAEDFARDDVETQMDQNTEGIFLGLNDSMNNPCNAQLYAGPMSRMGQTRMVEQETFCSQGQNSQIVAVIEDSRDWQRNYSELNAISIPGPPGSFLPSLDDLGSEDFEGNSSLTTSRVQSSEEPQDHVVYRHSPDSLVSADSTISNPSLAISKSKSSEKLHVQLPHVQTEVPHVANCAPAGAVFLEKILKNDNSCCFSSKDGTPQVGSPTSNYQDSLTLKRSSVDSVLPAPTGNTDLNRRAGIPSSRMEMFNQMSSGSKNTDFYGVKSSVVPDFTLKISGNSASPLPVSKYPVLRLMGKNLMVVNKDPDLPSLLQRQNFDGVFSNNFVSHVDLSTLQYASRVPNETGGGGVSSSSGGGFTATLKQHKYEGGIQYAN